MEFFPLRAPWVVRFLSGKSKKMVEKILIIGKPNSGKSLLFNRLTGLVQKVANFPGVTVEIKRGTFEGWEIIDFPGLYSMAPLTIDEKKTVEELRRFLANESVKTVVCVLDATRAERGLVFGLQAREEALKHGRSVLFVLNMIDEISKKNVSIDVEALERELGSRVVAISSKTGQGFEDFKGVLREMASRPNEKLLPEKGKKSTLHQAKELGERFGADPNVLLKGQNKWDRFFLHTFMGGISFFLVMIFLFQSIFTWSAPLMDAVEGLISYGGGVVGSFLSEGVIKDFFEDAIFGGFGAFLVFVPQIMVLTFIIGLLEDSGYLSRASLIVHRPLSFVGLSGRSFVPYLSSLACAIPAMMAARTIESPKKRLITVMTIPLMACSARLPVYSLLITALIPATPFLGGLITLQGLCFFGLFFFGIFMTLVVSIFLNKFTLKEESDIPFMIELTPYRFPHFKPLFIKSFNSAKSFVTNAGGIIFTVNVFVWVLGYFPRGPGNLEHSWLAFIGFVIDPVFAPLGIDWRYGVAILASFLAREVFVGTLGTLFGIEEADENIEGLATQIRSDGLEFSTGLALLVFYAIALQCVSTVAVMKKEIGNTRTPILVFVSYSFLAYLLALVVKWSFSVLSVAF